MAVISTGGIYLSKGQCDAYPGGGGPLNPGGPGNGMPGGKPGGLKPGGGAGMPGGANGTGGRPDGRPPTVWNEHEISTSVNGMDTRLGASFPYHDRQACRGLVLQGANRRILTRDNMGSPKIEN